jgi:glycosyltransferase involved in cell wall biosynthesis
MTAWLQSCADDRIIEEEPTMQIGILVPGFSSSEDDWAIPIHTNFARELAHDDDVRVLALRYPHRQDAYSVFGATVYPFGVGSWTRGIGRLKLWWTVLRKIRALHRERPFDLLQAFWADETGLLAAWAGRMLNIPVVVTISGGELVGFADIGYGLQLSRFGRWTVGQALRRADQIVAPTQYSKTLIRQAGYTVPDEKISVIPFGVDFGQFERRLTPPLNPLPVNGKGTSKTTFDLTTPLSPGGTECRVLGGRGAGGEGETDDQHASSAATKPTNLIHVASLVPVKDQATLLRAVALLENVTLDLVGDGSERERLQTLAAELGLTNQVNFRGNVSFTEVVEHYRRAALHLLTSRHDIGPMVVLEAAACGVPTVSTAVGIVPDAPELGVTVPVGDPEALAVAIRDLLDDPERLRNLRESAYQYVAANLTVRQMVERYRLLYAQTLGK